MLQALLLGLVLVCRSCFLTNSGGVNVLVADSAVYNTPDSASDALWGSAGAKDRGDANGSVSSPLEEMVEQSAKLPEVGRNSAQRLAFYVLD